MDAHKAIEKRDTTQNKPKRRVRKKSQKKSKPSGYDTEQLRAQVGTAAKSLADAQSRFTERVSRKPPMDKTADQTLSKSTKRRLRKKSLAGKVGREKKNFGKKKESDVQKDQVAPKSKTLRNSSMGAPKVNFDDPKEKIPTQFEKGSTPVETKDVTRIGSDQFRGRKDIAQVVSSTCVEAGFLPTGFPMRKFPKDYFENIGLKDHYLKYLEEQQGKACETQRELIDRKLNMVEALKAEKDFSAGIVTGVPGCGKSTVLKKIQGQATDTILLYANSNLESCYKSFENAFYTQSALVADINHTFSTILIDEYTLCESAEILLLQRKFRSSRVFLFGDRCQGDIDSLISPEWLKIPRLFEGKRSYRFGKQTAGLLKEFGLDIECSDLEDKVVKSGYEGPVDENSQCLCFSEKTKSDLIDCSINCTLVGDTQGQQYERVTLFVAEWDQEYLRNSQLLLVGLTRHKTYLELKTAPEVDLRNLSAAIVRTHSYAKRGSVET